MVKHYSEMTMQEQSTAIEKNLKVVNNNSIEAFHIFASNCAHLFFDVRNNYKPYIVEMYDYFEPEVNCRHLANKKVSLWVINKEFNTDSTNTKTYKINNLILSAEKYA